MIEIDSQSRLVVDRPIAFFEVKFTSMIDNLIEDFGSIREHFLYCEIG